MSFSSSNAMIIAPEDQPQFEREVTLATPVATPCFGYRVDPIAAGRRHVQSGHNEKKTVAIAAQFAQTRNMQRISVGLGAFLLSIFQSTDNHSRVVKGMLADKCVPRGWLDVERDAVLFRSRYGARGQSRSGHVPKGVAAPGVQCVGVTGIRIHYPRLDVPLPRQAA